MFMTPAMTGDLADAHRRELHAAAARRRLLRAARRQRARSVRASGFDSPRGVARPRGSALVPRAGTR
jgi:hypothetical protein